MNHYGKMVRYAREARGMSQSTLAERTDELQSTISSIENDKVSDDSVLKKIGDVLGFPTSLFQIEPSHSRLSKFYYRKRESFPTKMLDPLEAKMQILRVSYRQLLNEVDMNKRGLPEMCVTNERSAEQIAEFIRLFFNLDDSPIDNPITIIEKAGIAVFYVDVDSDKFSGLTIQTDNNFPIIILNKNMPNDHKKFTIFHELGHLIMHAPFTEEPEFYENKSKEILEQEADAFASAFLMPASRAKISLSHITYSRLTDLKLYWKVSKQAIMYRAKTLGLITDAKFKSLYIELSRNGERKKENISITIDQPTLLKKIVQVYENNIGYTIDSLAYKVGLNAQEFQLSFGLIDPPLFTIKRNIS